MDRWVLYGFISMAFAGFTSVIAKLGLTGISGDLGLAIRTCFVFVFGANRENGKNRALSSMPGP
jgi:transporter family protein